jgi:zinc protease
LRLDRRLARALTPLIFVAASLVAGPSGAHAAMFDPKTFTLANGLEVVVIENPRAPIVVQMVWYRVGAADEPPGKSGIAHFLEHLMFKGTPSVPPGEFSKIVARNGGQDNAFTTSDYTAYFQRVAKDRLELVMKLEADRMKNLVLSDEVVLPERDVVLEERRSRTDNDPGARLYEAANAAMYLKHPYRNPVIGWEDEIKRLSTEDALAFYRTYYAPNNAILIIAGDIKVADVRRLAERYYAPIPSRPIPPRVRSVEPEQEAARRVELRSAEVRQPGWSRRYLAPSLNRGETRHAYALQIAAEVLGGGPTSRLYKALVVERKVATSANAWYTANAFDLSEFGFGVVPRQGTEMAKLEEAMDAELRRLLDQGIDATEVATAKKTLAASAIYARDSLRSGPNVIGRALATGRTVEEVESWPERIQAVTVEDVNVAIRAILNDRRSVTSLLLPGPAS